MTGRATREGLAGIAAVLLLAGCMGPRTAGGAGGVDPLEGTAWTLAELNGQPPAAGGATPTLQFSAQERRVGGNGGCNQFSGPYTQSGTSLRLGPLVSTRRACADPAATAQEAAYLRALQSTTSYAVSSDLLVLYAGAQPAARLRRSGG